MGIPPATQLLWDFLHGPFKQKLLETTPSMEVRNQYKHMNVEITDTIPPEPFPVITVKIYPNGKPEGTAS